MTDTANMQLRQTLIIHWETAHCDHSGEFARVRMRLSPIRVYVLIKGSPSQLLFFAALDLCHKVVRHEPTFKLCAESARSVHTSSRILSSRRISRNISPPTPPLGTFRLLSCQSAKQERAEHDKKNIRKPNEKLRVHFRICAQRVADDDEEEIADRHDQ